MNDTYVTIDKVNWWVYTVKKIRFVQPLCREHGLRLKLIRDHYAYQVTLDHSRTLKCADCDEPLRISRSYSDEVEYVKDRIDAKTFKNIKFINLDDEALPIAKEKISSDDNKFFVTSLLTQSKTGLRLVVYAGLKGSKKKTQIFVEPEIKRLAFDQKDLHPTEVFTKLEAIFIDGNLHKISKEDE